MRPYALALTLLAALARFAAAQEPQDPAALIDQAIAAHGGEAALRQWENLEYEGEATTRFGPEETRSRTRIYVRDGTMLRTETRTTFRGMTFEGASGSTGKTAWSRFRSRVYDLPPDNSTTMLRHRPDILLRARAAPAGALRLAGRAEVGGDPVVVVAFDEEGGTARLLLDAETTLVRGVEYHAVDVGGEGTRDEVLYQRLFSDYREVEGVPFPHRMESFEDGVSSGWTQVERVVLGQAPPRELFSRPQPDPESREWFDQIAH